MLNKEKLIYTCERDSDFGARLIDNLLIPLVKDKERMDSLFAQKLQAEYGHLLEELAPEWVYGFTEQYIAAQLFGPRRLLKAYMPDRRIQNRSSRERSFLEAKLFNPWRFAFLRIKEELGRDFFKMHNVLTDETLLLYSPGVGKYEEEGANSLYFSLLTFNGECYQTYGPIIRFVGLQPFDLLYFAGQLDHAIAEYSAVDAKLQEDPLPFMLLVVSSRFPLSYHKDDQLVISLTKLPLASLDVERWRDAFKIEKQKGVYQFTLKRWGRHPHFAHCHYAPDDGVFVASAGTDRAWKRLVDEIRAQGVELDGEPRIYTTVMGRIAAQRVLGRSGAKSPYADLFIPEVTPAEQEGLDRANYFLSLLVPYLNEGRDYDLGKLAAEADLAYEEAQIIEEQVVKTLKKMR